MEHQSSLNPSQKQRREFRNQIILREAETLDEAERVANQLVNLRKLNHARIHIKPYDRLIPNVRKGTQSWPPSTARQVMYLISILHVVYYD
jgi:hypothetical protein